MTASYDWWQQALADPHKIGASLKIHEGHPQPGFYRKRAYKDGPFVPVAIWQDDTGHMLAVAGGKAVDAGDVWTFCCRQPISEEVYRAVAAGGAWPDEPAPIGHNSNVSDDPHAQLAHDLASETETATSFLKKPIATKDDADRAAVWSKRLAAIAKKATDQHKVEKQPHLDAGRTVDEKWRPIREGADELSKKLKRHLDDWLREQDRIERERQAKAREEAERIRREAEDAARKAAEVEQAPEAERAAALDRARKLQDEARDAERDAEARNAAAGRTGAKVALRTFVSAEITDYDALVAALKDRPEVRDVVQSLANRAAKSGVDLPGMKIVEERRAA
jgi:hypothetical protein